MSPRASLPGADELFRATSPRSRAETGAAVAATSDPAAGAGAGSSAAPPGSLPDPPGHGSTTRIRRGHSGERASTGRERHEEKITVYVSAAELVDLERARLTLRAEHGIAVDRGRIVREALSVLLADLDGKAAESILVRRLAGT